MKTIGVIFAVIAWILWLIAVVATGGLGLLSLLYLIPGLAIGANRQRTWYNTSNWLHWLPLFGIIVVMFKQEESTQGEK